MKELLTEREFQVAELLAWGALRKEIPTLLVKQGFADKEISINTINNILANIYAKLSLNNETELSAWYFCEIQGVDSSKSPLKDLKRKMLAIMFLAILLPQITNLDQAIRPARAATRTVRTQGSRARARRGKDELDLSSLL